MMTDSGRGSEETDPEEGIWNSDRRADLRRDSHGEAPRSQT
jgi:hypothetical protein